MTEPAVAPKPNKFEVDVTVTSGVETTPWTFNLRVASVSGVEIVSEQGNEMPIVLTRTVNAGDSEFFRWIDEDWVADLVIIMNNIRFLIKDCKANYLYFGELGKSENKGLKETLCLSCSKITPSYRT